MPERERPPALCLVRLLDSETRRRCFEPSYLEALADHLEAQAIRAGPARALGALRFRLAVCLMVLECARLGRERRSGQNRKAAQFARSCATGRKGDGIMFLLWQDLRYGARGFLRNPGFTLVAALTLTLGIGANTAVFSVINAVLLRSLPYADSGRLIAVWANDANAKDDHSYYSGPAVIEFRGQSRSFANLAGISPRWSFDLKGEGEPARLYGYYASADFFETLSVTPLLGRGFTSEDDRPSAPVTVLLSHGLWQRRFGGDPAVLGRSITLDDGRASVIGVLPPDFRWLEEADVWLPLELNPFVQRGRAVRLCTMIGRLHPGVTIEQARAEFSGIAAQLASQYVNTDAGLGASLFPLQEEVVGKIRPMLLVLAGAVGLVLLIACANVANLLLARATARCRQLAIRAAIGAGRGRLVRELLAESLLLSLLGGLGGISLAVLGVRALVSLAPAALPRIEEIAVDGKVLLFTLAVALAASMVFGLIPAHYASRLDLSGALKEGGHGGGVAGRHRLRTALVVAEVALSVVVVAGASLLMRSFARLQSVNPGFNKERVVSMDLSSLGSDTAQRSALMEEIYLRLHALPGVVAAGEVSRLPLSGVGGNPASNLVIEKRPVPRGKEPQVDFRRASREYFRTMSIPLLAGRMFLESDNAERNTPGVALINQAAAEKFFPGENPLGQRVQLGGGPWLTVVGVVGNVRHLRLDTQPRPEAYIHTLQGPLNNPQLVVRLAGDPAAAVSAIRGVVHSVGPNIVISRIYTMEEVLNRSLAGPRFDTMLFGVFAALALALGLVGIHGVMAFTVTQRTHEIGVRMALGARRLDVLYLVVGQGMRLAGVGIALGMAGALAATRLMQTLLFEISPADPLSFTAVILLLAAAALVASLAPALRATRVDPLTALRCE